MRVRTYFIPGTFHTYSDRHDVLGCLLLCGGLIALLQQLSCVVLCCARGSTTYILVHILYYCCTAVAVYRCSGSAHHAIGMTDRRSKVDAPTF